MTMNKDAQIRRIPPEHIRMIRQLASEGLPVGRIAFLTHMTEGTVREVLAAPVNTTEEEPRQIEGDRASDE
jgi:hypothetical protein